MCELLGMSANVPTDICFSFTGLIRRAGVTGPHKDGWGIAFYEGKGSRVFRDPQPGSHSPIARLVEVYPIKSQIVISHVRRANSGKVSLENTHPFTRELWGKNWTFAHNGQLKGIKKKAGGFFTPVGTTDSEYAFCWMLNRIREEFPRKPSQQMLIRRMSELFTDLSDLGVFNVLLSDGELLFAHCSTRLSWITRKAPFGQARLVDSDLKIDFQKETSSNDIVTVVATRPLTLDEQWTLMSSGELKIFKNGLPVHLKK